MSAYHSDPEAKKREKPERVVKIRCGECVEKIEATPLTLAGAYELHKATCRRSA